MQLASTAAHFRLRQFLSLTKPRVVSLIVFCAVIGILFTCLTLADLEAAMLQDFLRGQMAFREMFGSSIFARMKID